MLLSLPTAGACECEVLGREELDSAGQLDRCYRSPLLWKCARARWQGWRKWPQLGQHAAGGGRIRTDARRSRSRRGYGVWAWIGAIGRHLRTPQEQCEDSDDGSGRAENRRRGRAEDTVVSRSETRGIGSRLLLCRKQCFVRRIGGVPCQTQQEQERERERGEDGLFRKYARVNGIGEVTMDRRASVDSLLWEQ